MRSRLDAAWWWRLSRLVSQPENVNVAFVTHHKTGTVLAQRVARIFKLGQRVNLFNGENRPEKTARLTRSNSEGNSIALYPHANLAPTDMDRFHRVYHFVRDPAGMAISSAIYHQKGSEPWLHIKPSEWSEIPAAFRSQHPMEQLEFILRELDGKTYYERIRSMSLDEAIAFELRMCAAWNIRDMKAFAARSGLIEVNVHRSDFSYRAFWSDVVNELEGHSLARKLIQNRIERFDRSRASSWNARQRAHLSGQSNYAQHWTERHEALLHEYGLNWSTH